MENGAITASYLLRLTGFFGVAVGIAWAAQTLGFGHETLGAKITWVIAAAAMSGAGAGLIVAASGLEQPELRAARA